MSYSTERDQDHKYILGSNAGDISMIIGPLMEIENCQIHGQVSQDSLR